MPFSNDRQEGLENRLADLVARELGQRVEYTWWSQKRGFIRNSLGADLCDVEMGVPETLPTVAATIPYYRSMYVWVTRKDRGEAVAGFADPRLRDWRIGIHQTGNDYAPPALALARRGLAANLRPYSLYGAYGVENPPARLIDAVRSGEVDVAIVWGPLAGYFAGRDLRITPIVPDSADGPPFTFAISIGVRKGEEALRDRLNGVLTRRCSEVRRIILEYRVPAEEQSCAN
jgi:mxaJ protein